MAAYNFTVQAPSEESIQDRMPAGVTWVFSVESDGGRRITTSRALTEEELDYLREGMQDSGLVYAP